MNDINFSEFDFHPVIPLPENYEVYDLSEGYDHNRMLDCEYGVGKYNEKRLDMYTSNLFEGVRNIHMGIDIGAPVGTPIHSFWDGEVFLFGYNGAELDYGNTLITRHVLQGVELFALYGHLSATSIQNKKEGQVISKSEVIAWVGERFENGGWNPHLHFQLSYERPTVPDLPGVVSEEDREEALSKYPDPRLVLGPLY